MKTLLVLSALTAVALAAPFEQGAEDITNLPNIPDDRERIFQQESGNSDFESETAVNLPSSSRVQFGVTGRSFGLKKPIIFKKKPMGYQVYRDSEEVPSESGETCGSQIKVKFCDGKAKSKTTSIGGNNQQNEEDMKHSLTLAKEAIENLERDFSKVENTKANSWNHGKLKADVELHQDIEVAREALAHILTHFGNFETMNLDATTLKEANVATEGPFAIAKTEEQRLAQWKDAIDTIQKNVEIAKNIEDSFRMVSVDETKLMMESNSMMNENHIPELNREIDSIMRTADNVEPEQKNGKTEKACKNIHKKLNEREVESNDMAASASTISENNEKKDDAIQNPVSLVDNKIEQTVNSDISMKNKNLDADNLTILVHNKDSQDKNKEEQSQNHVEQKDDKEQQGQINLGKNETDLKQDKIKNDLDNNKGEQSGNKAEKEINLGGLDANKLQVNIDDGQNQILGHEGHTKEEHDRIIGNQGKNKKDQDQTAEGQDNILKNQDQNNREQEKIEEKQHSKEEQNKITDGQDKMLGHEGHTKEEHDKIPANQGQNKAEKDNLTEGHDKNIENQSETTQEPANFTGQKNKILGNQGLNKQGQDSSKEKLDSTTEGQWKGILGHEGHSKEEHEKISKEKNRILENQDKNKEEHDNGKGELDSAMADQNKMPEHGGYTKEEHAKIMKNQIYDKEEQNKVSDEKNKILENQDNNKEGQDNSKEGLDSTTEGQWKKMLGHEGHNKEEHDRIIGIPSQNKEEQNKISDEKDHNLGGQDQNKKIENNSKESQDIITEGQTKVLGHEGHSNEEHDRIIGNESLNKEEQDMLTQEKEEQIAKNQDKILGNLKEKKKSGESEEQDKIVEQQNQNEEKQDQNSKGYSVIIKGQSQTQADQNNQVEQDKALKEQQNNETGQKKESELRENTDGSNIPVSKMRSSETEDQLYLTSNIKNKDEGKLEADLHTEQSKQVETLFLKSAEVPTTTQDNFFNPIVQEKMTLNEPETALPKMANNIEMKTHHTVLKSINDIEELEMQHALPIHSSGMRTTEHMPNSHQQHMMNARSRWADEKNTHKHHRDWMTSPKGIHSHIVQHPGHHHHITHGMRTQNQQFEMPSNQGLHTRFPENFMTQEKAANPEFQAHYMSMREPQMLDSSRMAWKSMGPRSAYGSPAAPIAASGPQGGSALGVFPNAHVGSCGIPLLLSCNPSVVSGNLAKPASVPYSAPAYRTEEDLSFLTKRDLKKGHENKLNALLRTSQGHEKISTVSGAKQ